MAAVLAMDIGSTRIKALALAADGTPERVHAVPSVLQMPRPGEAVVDADALWGQVLQLLRQAAETSPRPAALAISNQRATVFLLDEAARPLAPGLSWQDGRGAAEMAQFMAQVGTEHFRQITGLAPSVIWSLAKILWWRSRGLPAGARFATIQDWLLHRLGAEGWFIDPANASLTGLLAIRSLTWDPDLLRAAGVEPAQLPSLLPSATPVGVLSSDVALATGLPSGLPLILGGGDQQCADLGVGAIDAGQVSVNLGTAGVVSAPISQPAIDPLGRLVCLAHVRPGTWVLEGLEGSYGGAVQWGRRLLREDLPALAREVPMGSRGLLFYPYLAGSGAPDNDPRARGVLLGLTIAHDRADVARAVLEGVTLELVRILAAMRELAPVHQLLASGGGERERLLLDLLANCSDLPVACAPHPESSLIGAGLLAWVGLGRWPNVTSAVATLPTPTAWVRPDPQLAHSCGQLYSRYQATLERLRSGELLALSEIMNG
jgi:xylulokinase